MFNISITILTPVLTEPMHLFHDDIDNPQVIIVGKGGPAGYEIQTTHFLATVSRRPNVKLPGSTLNSEQRKIHKLHRYEFVKKLSQSHLIDSEKKHVVSQLLNLNKNMENLDK